MTMGFRVLPRARKVDAATIEQFKALPVANVSDCMARMSGGGATLRPLHKGGGLAGPALTVRTRPGDNLMVHKALKMIEPGDVIVVDAGGDLTNAIVGELMLSYAMKAGAAGMIINGAIRDSAWIAQNDFPVYAAGVTHRGPYRDGPGEINLPVAFGGMVIQPGDLVLGDDDGLLCVPLDEAAGVYKAAKAKHDAEAKQYADTMAGKLDAKEWVDQALKRLGCEGV